MFSIALFFIYTKFIQIQVWVTHMAKFMGVGGGVGKCHPYQDFLDKNSVFFRQKFSLLRQNLSFIFETNLFLF